MWRDAGFSLFTWLYKKGHDETCPFSIGNERERFYEGSKLYPTGNRNRTHNELHRRITGISFKTLASVLRALARDGLVARTEYPQIPPKVEYALTQRGRSLIPILYMMCDWGERHRNMRKTL